MKRRVVLALRGITEGLGKEWEAKAPFTQGLASLETSCVAYHHFHVW